MKANLFFLMVLLWPMQGFCQTVRDSVRGTCPLTIGGRLYYGNFVKHSPKLTTRTGQAVPGAELSFSWQTNGKHPWQIARHYPAMGLSLIWQYPGEGAHGHIFGIFPNITLYWLRRPAWQGCFRVGSGIALAQRPYNSFTNPGENALGSKLNNVTQFHLGIRRALGPHFQLNLGAQLTHFSNAGYQLPNFGMNIPGISAGLGYSLRKTTLPFLGQTPGSRKPGRRWGAALQAGVAQIEYVSIDGPRYIVWAVSGAATYRMHRYNRAYAGFEAEHNQGVEDWLFNNALLGSDRETARRGAQRRAVFLADEFLFGPMGIYLQASYHVGQYPLNTFIIGKNYNKLAARYYFKLHKNGLKAHMGVSLKAYKAVAESISLTSGFVF